MRTYLMETNKHSNSLKLYNEAVDVSTNLQQAWLTEDVVFNPVSKHPFGRRIDNKAQSESDTHPFVDLFNSLYPNYLDYAHGVSSGKPSARF